MTDEEAQAISSRLRRELATAVAAAAVREQQLRSELDERFVETAELTRQLMVARRRTNTAKRELAALQSIVEARKVGAVRRFATRVRGRLRRDLARARGAK